MAVGAGSIRRAAKANVDVVKNVEVKESEATKVVGENPVEVKKTSVAKKASEKKTAATKKTTVAKKALEKEAVMEEQTVNQVCHITEELPIYLL